MNTRLGVLVLVGASLLAACSSNRPAGPRAPLHHAVAAIAVKVGRSMVDLAEVIVWRAPKLILYELPSWLFYHGPKRLALALSSKVERVGALIASLANADEETGLATVEKLRELTGLPLEDAAAWQAWWRTASARPEDQWKADFADACLRDLESEDFLARQAGDDLLRVLSGRDLGYDPKGSEDERRAGVERWRVWRVETFGPGGDAR